MPNVNERPVVTGQPLVPPADVDDHAVDAVDPKPEVVASGEDVPKPKPAAVDGVDKPREAPEGGAPDDPRVVLSLKLGTMGRRILKGAAILGLAVGLAVGGTVWMKMAQHQPVQPPVPIEVPVQIDKPGLPQGQAPPATETQPQTQGGASETAPGGLPTAPTDTTGPTFDPGSIQGPGTFSPHTIRLDGVLPNQ